MGTEYERWLIARGNVFAPSAEAIAKFVEKLRAERWIVDPESPEFAKLAFRGPWAEYGRTTGAYACRRIGGAAAPAQLTARIAASTESVPATLDAEWLKDPSREDMRLVWLVQSEEPLSVRYPLTRKPDGPTLYHLEIHRAVDFVYPISESIDPLDTECRCGNDLAFEPDPKTDPFGATTGIYTECDECSRTFDPSKVTATIKNPIDGSEDEVPGGAAYRFAIKVDCKKAFVEDPKLAFSPELVALVEKEFGRSFYEVGSIY